MAVLQRCGARVDHRSFDGVPGLQHGMLLMPWLARGCGLGDFVGYSGARACAAPQALAGGSKWHARGT